MPKIIIIIPTFNSAPYIHNCIKSLQSEIKKNEISASIIIIDNDSKDSTLNKIKDLPGINIIKNPKNYGFAKAVNIGIKSKRSNYVLLLNPDTTIDKNAISNLLKCAKQNNAGIASGLIYDFSKKKQQSFAKKPTISTLLFIYTNLRKIVPFDYIYKSHYYVYEKINSTKKVDVVSGGFMLIERKVFNKIGYFDERFFMYLEDVDFCVRALKKGIKTIICPKARIKHYGGGSSPNKDRVLHSAWIDSRRYYAQKHFGTLTNFLVQKIFTIDAIIINIRRLNKIHVHQKNSH